MLIRCELLQSTRLLWFDQSQSLGEKQLPRLCCSREFRCPNRKPTWDYRFWPEGFRRASQGLHCWSLSLLLLAECNLNQIKSTRSGYALNLECFDGQKRSISCVSIVSSTSAVKFLGVFFGRVEDRVVGAEAFVPAFEGRLLIVVTIEEIGLI